MAVSGNPNIYLMPFHKRQIQKVFFLDINMLCSQFCFIPILMNPQSWGYFITLKENWKRKRKAT